MSKSDTRRTAEEATCEGAREKIREALMLRARELAAYYVEAIRTGKIKLRSISVKLAFRVELQDIDFPTTIKNSQLIGDQEVHFFGDDLKKPDEGIVMMLETNERKWNAGLLCPKCASDDLAQNPDQLYRYCKNCGHYPIDKSQ